MLSILSSNWIQIQMGRQSVPKWRTLLDGRASQQYGSIQPLLEGKERDKTRCFVTTSTRHVGFRCSRVFFWVACNILHVHLFDFVYLSSSIAKFICCLVPPPLSRHDFFFFGSCNDGPMGGVVSLNQSGKLTGMLQSAGAL